MADFRYTLVSDGSSDRALLPILTWLIRQHKDDAAIQSEWADLGALPKPPRTLAEKIVVAQKLWPADLLFVHRDAERVNLEVRLTEVSRALAAVQVVEHLPPVITVIPVRMHEAWLLFDDGAIRMAAGNPNGQMPLILPDLRRVENLVDPKYDLHEALALASGLTGRRLKRFNAPTCAWAVSKYIDDFSQLRVLPAFRSLEEQLIGQLAAM